MTDASLLRQIRSLIHDAKSITVLTGAGMSAESGIPTFRQAQSGLWAQFSPKALATPEAWQRDPALVWGWYVWRMAGVRATQPNAGHHALARAAKTRTIRIVTQNVDDLHERAGSREVIHLHGSLFAHRCSACARPFADVDLPAPDAEPQFIPPPRCTDCAELIRPGVVWFGENLPEVPFQAAVAASRDCDLMLVVGTAGVVHPAAALPAFARQHGAHIIEINPMKTELSVLADICLRGTAATMLPALFDTRAAPA